MSEASVSGDMDTKDMRPLAGTTVIDVTHHWAGPSCTYQLALLGANVIKIEARGKGDELRSFHPHVENTDMSAQFMAINAGKRSLSLDLKTPEGLEILHKLIKSADVLVQNYRPETAQRMGIGPEECTRINDQLIYCAVSGFGASGPMKDFPAFDPTIQAMSGFMTMRGPDQPPSAVPFIIVDTITGHFAHAAVMAALLQRDLTGKGQKIDISMFDAAVKLQMSPLYRYMMTGEVLRDRGNRAGRDNVGALLLETQHGHIWVAANYQPQFEALCRVIGGESILADERFAVHEARRDNIDELEKVLQSHLHARSAIEWEPLLNEAGCPAGAVRTLSEVAEMPILRERGLLVDADVTGLDRKIALFNAGYVFGHDGPGITGPVPALGQHTDEILTELGYHPQEVESLRRNEIV